MDPLSADGLYVYIGSVDSLASASMFYFYLFDLDVMVATVQLTVGVEELTMTDDVKDSRSLGLRP